MPNHSTRYLRKGPKPKQHPKQEKTTGAEVYAILNTFSSGQVLH